MTLQDASDSIDESYSTLRQLLPVFLHSPTNAFMTRFSGWLVDLD
jgi:hypothetical protein